MLKRNSVRRNLLAAVFVFLTFSTPAYAVCSSPPGDAGTQIYNSTHNVMQYCNGNQWIAMGSGGGGSGSDTLGDLSCATGESIEFDGTNWNCVGGKVSRAGDTMTGTLDVSMPTAGTHAATKGYVDTAIAAATAGASGGSAGNTTCMYFWSDDHPTCPNGWEQIGSNGAYRPYSGGTHKVCCMGGGALGDEMPSAFDFPDAPSTGYAAGHTWSPLQIAGFDSATVNITTSPANIGTAEFRTCADASCNNVLKNWRELSTGIADGNYLQIRIGAATAARPNGSKVVIAVGGMSDEAGINDTCETSGIGTVCADNAFYIGTISSWRVYARAGDSSTSVQWKTANSDTSNTDDANDGKANTNGMIAAGASAHPAAQTCRTHGTDWHVPSQNELALIWTNRTTLNLASRGINTGGTYYWSSTQYNNTLAYAQRFSDGNQSSYNKNNSLRLRCVRR